MMTDIAGLITAIGKADITEEEKADAFAIIKEKLNVYVDYIGHVIATEVLKDMIVTGCTSGSDDYMYMRADENRSSVHDECILACQRLNRLCDDIDIDHICNFDTNDRHKVAEFVGRIISEIYGKGIGCVSKE